MGGGGKIKKLKEREKEIEGPRERETGERKRERNLKKISVQSILCHMLKITKDVNC